MKKIVTEHEAYIYFLYFVPSVYLFVSYWMDWNVCFVAIQIRQDLGYKLFRRLAPMKNKMKNNADMNHEYE